MIIQNIKSVNQAPQVRTAPLPVHQHVFSTSMQRTIKVLQQHQIIQSLKYRVFSRSESLCRQLSHIPYKWISRRYKKPTTSVPIIFYINIFPDDLCVFYCLSVSFKHEVVFFNLPIDVHSFSHEYVIVMIKKQFNNVPHIIPFGVPYQCIVCRQIFLT